MRKIIFAIALLFAMSVAASPAVACLPEDPGISFC